jgi:hypothetical protein
MEEERLPIFTALHQEEKERPPCNWKTDIKSITEDKGLEDGDWENRLLWKLKMEHPSRDEPRT